MFMNYVKPNKGKSIEERRAEVIADNQELWGTQTGSGVSTGASSGASTGTNTGTDDYRYYHGAYNGKMNKMPDINAKKPAERPEESWFKDEDFLPRDDDYKDEAWEKAFIEAFLEESGVKTPRSKKADALNGVPAAKPSVEDFFNHYGKPSFSFEDIIEDYRKSNAALLGGNKFPSQEMILQKENDLPGYRPGNYLRSEGIQHYIKEMEKLLEEKKEEWNKIGRTDIIVSKGINAGRTGKIDINYDEIKALEKEIARIENEIMLAKSYQKEYELNFIKNDGKKMTAGINEYLKYLEEKGLIKEFRGGLLEKSAEGYNPLSPTSSLVLGEEGLRWDTSYKEPNDKWSETEKAVFGYYLSIGEVKKAEEYAIEINNNINREKEAKEEERIASNASKNVGNGILYSLGSLLTSPTNLLGYFMYRQEMAARGTITEDGIVMPWEKGNAARTGIADELNAKGDVLGVGLGDIYKASMNAADYVLPAKLLKALGAIATTAGKTATTSVDDALARGIEPQKALEYADAMVLADVAMELLSSKKIFGGKSATNKVEFLEDLARQSGKEVLDASGSFLLGNAVDSFILEENSRYNTLVKQYQLAGYSLEEANKLAFGDMRKDYFGDVAVDTLSGTALRGMATVEDLAEYNNYRKNLGKNAPNSFDEYWNLKYHGDSWEQFKNYSESIQTGELSAFADFDLYLKTEQDINNALVGKTASGGIKITGQSPEFINNVIGSVSGKKSGVEISDIEKALQTRPIKIGNKVCYFLDGVCEVYINPLSGELIGVLSLMR